jgi:hypothetical protein
VARVIAARVIQKQARGYIEKNKDSWVFRIRQTLRRIKKEMRFRIRQLTL